MTFSRPPNAEVAACGQSETPGLAVAGSQESGGIMELSEYLHDNIGRYVPLRLRGALFVGLCPFHKEENPSFTVNPANNTFHCFGCGAHGHAEDFEMDLRRAKGNG